MRDEMRSESVPDSTTPPSSIRRRACSTKSGLPPHSAASFSPSCSEPGEVPRIRRARVTTSSMSSGSRTRVSVAVHSSTSLPLAAVTITHSGPSPGASTSRSSTPSDVAS